MHGTVFHLTEPKVKEIGFRYYSFLKNPLLESIGASERGVFLNTFLFLFLWRENHLHCPREWEDPES